MSMRFFKLYTSHFNVRSMSFWKQLVLFVETLIVGHVVERLVRRFALQHLYAFDLDLRVWYC